MKKLAITTLTAAGIAGAILSAAPASVAGADAGSHCRPSDQLGNSATTSDATTLRCLAGNKLVPASTATPFTSTGTAAAQTAPTTAMANGNRSVPATTATPFTGSQGRTTPGLNPHPRAHRLLTIGPLGGLLGPLGGLLG